MAPLINIQRSLCVFQVPRGAFRKGRQSFYMFRCHYQSFNHIFNTILMTSRLLPYFFSFSSFYDYFSATRRTRHSFLECAKNFNLIVYRLQTIISQSEMVMKKILFFIAVLHERERSCSGTRFHCAKKKIN
jgi:hypothetical protein